MRQEGFQPAAVVQTSPGNYQVWIKHSTRLDKELGTAVARELAKRFGGDVKAADWRHFGRSAGFRNTKSRYGVVVPVPEFDEWRGQKFHRDLEGRWVDHDGNVVHRGAVAGDAWRPVAEDLFPFVRLVEASGVVARESEQSIATVRAGLERERAHRARAQASFGRRRQDRTGGH